LYPEATVPEEYVLVKRNELRVWWSLSVSRGAGRVKALGFAWEVDLHWVHAEPGDVR
jgi:hypothetical protein